MMVREKYQVLTIMEAPIPFITLDRQERDGYGLCLNDVVTVKQGINACPARVVMQLKDFIGSETVHISTPLARWLDVIEGDWIEITGRVSPEDRDKFDKAESEYMFKRIPPELKAMFSAMQAGNFNFRYDSQQIDNLPIGQTEQKEQKEQGKDGIEHKKKGGK